MQFLRKKSFCDIWYVHQWDCRFWSHGCLVEYGVEIHGSHWRLWVSDYVSFLCHLSYSVKENSFFTFFGRKNLWNWCKPSFLMKKHYWNQFQDSNLQSCTTLQISLNQISIIKLYWKILIKQIKLISGGFDRP